MMANRQLRYLSSAPATAEIRTAVHDGITHIVVPVVALMGDSVIRGMNSAGPEFVPSDVLARSTVGWNGRPVLADHPYDGTQSANEPRTLEKYRFGSVFGSTYDDKRLRFNLWLDPGRADRVGKGAQQVIADVNANRMVEGSTGCYVVVSARNGVAPSGERYEYVWTDIVAADHYAFGLNGNDGACSVEDGCGGPRVQRAVGLRSNTRRHDRPRVVMVNPRGRYEFTFKQLKGGR